MEDQYIDSDTDVVLRVPASEASLISTLTGYKVDASGYIYTGFDEKVNTTGMENFLDLIVPFDSTIDEKMEAFFDKELVQSHMKDYNGFYYYYGITFVPTKKENRISCENDPRILMHKFLTVLHSFDLELYDIAIEYKHHYHLHGTVKSKKLLRYKDIKSYGWHIYMRQITDLQKWTNYCHKSVSYKFC